MSEFLADTLTSQQLLALLYACETKRKGLNAPEGWDALLDVFATRLSHLSEQMRLEVLGAHLMSVEDIDIYDDSLITSLLTENRTLIDTFSERLGADPRFSGVTV